MTSRHLRLVSRRTRRPRLRRFITAWTLVSIGMLSSIAIAWGQGERSYPLVTEIWMSGEDLAVTRHVPQDPRHAQHSYDEVARSMVDIAESRYQDRDAERAQWLFQWARELTDGRIGKDPRAASRYQQSQEAAVSTMMQPKSLEEEYVAPAIPQFDPTELAIEWPISAFTDESIPKVTQPIAAQTELSRNSQRLDNGLELVSAPGTEGKRSADGRRGRDATSSEAYVDTVAAAVHASFGAQRSRRFNPRENSAENAERQVASVPTNIQQGIADHLPHPAPTVPTEQPIMLALSCFAAGVACCFVLHALLLLTPVRLTVRRSEVSTNQTSDNSSAKVSPTGEKLEPARTGTCSTRTHMPTRDLSQRDKASSMVEEFYNSNIGLFEKLAQSGD